MAGEPSSLDRALAGLRAPAAQCRGKNGALWKRDYGLGRCLTAGGGMGTTQGRASTNPPASQRPCPPVGRFHRC
jgi:hypothetical protein